MKTNSQLAQIVADRLSERVFEDMMELIADLTHDVMVDEGIDITTEDAYSDMLDISSRIYIGAN